MTPNQEASINARLSIERALCITDLRAVFRAVRAQRPFTLDAVVILPGHLHGVWTLPPGDADDALRWRDIKSRFSRRVPAGEPRSIGRAHKRERGIWQRRYWEHTLCDECDAARHIDYLHYNPVKHGQVSRVAAWPNSSHSQLLKRAMHRHRPRSTFLGSSIDEPRRAKRGARSPQ